jgi:predicted transposase YdaD
MVAVDQQTERGRDEGRNEGRKGGRKEGRKEAVMPNRGTVPVFV